MFLSETYLKQKLKECGYKMTYQRKVLLEILAQNKGHHLSLDELYASAKKIYPDIGIATVYRAINLLDRINVVYKLFLEDGKIRYELNDNEGSHKYHHLICMKCESVCQMDTTFLEKIEEEVLDKKEFLIKDHRIKFYGYCKNCKNS